VSFERVLQAVVLEGRPMVVVVVNSLIGAVCPGKKPATVLRLGSGVVVA
jgi:hypothetical protein